MIDGLLLLKLRGLLYKMGDQEYINMWTEEKSKLEKHLLDNNLSIKGLSNKLGSPNVNRLVSELTILNQILKLAKNNATLTRDVECVGHTCAGAKLQKDAIYDLLMVATGGGVESIFTALGEYFGPLKDYIMSRYDSGIEECKKLLECT